jgi:Icc protein
MAEHLLTFVHLSDTHLHIDPEYTGDFVTFSSRPSVAALIDHINALPFPIDFVLHTGDIMTDPQPDHYTAARDLLQAIRFPVYYLPGNHDRVEPLQRMMLNRAPADILLPMDYQFEVNGVQIVCLDSVQPDTAIGKLELSQLQWLSEAATPDDPRPLVVALHHHPIPLESPWLDSIALVNGLELHRILLNVRHRLRGVFYGHIHENVITVRDGISYYSTLSAWFQTRTWYGQAEPFNDPSHDPGFNVVTLTARDTFVRQFRVRL